MTPEEWKKLKPILIEALELDSVDRSEFLGARISDANELEQIRELLKFEEESKLLMNLSAGEFAGELLSNDDEASPLIGKKIGDYEIVSELGSGGMGAVYLAERSDGKFERKVAIKMLKRELNSDRIRRRFEIEKEIQAKLQHPNIAALVDAGTTQDGVPYLVVEYIDGKPIDRYCDQNGLGLKDRLKLFNRVCKAVAFAHRALIVHRDLKPSNILVTADGEPKLLDFGIAKLLDETIESEHLITHLGVMTPQYASPEQIYGEAVTTATDVYSLGIILFRLLTGRLPFELKNKTNGDLLREITESAPRLASDALDRMKTARSTEFSFSSAQLKGDLDLIAAMAIRKEPERRYETVEQFAADIWRYIDGQPVLARRPTFGYRASRFYKRNRTAVSAAILIFIALIIGAGGAIWQAQEARGQAALAKLESESARAEQAKSEKISKFMAKVLSYANPAWYAPGVQLRGQARVIDVMKEMGDDIDVEFAGQPDLQAELHHKFAEVYLSHASEFRPKAQLHIRKALELRKQYYGEHHDLVAKDMAYVYWAAGSSRTETEIAMLASAITMMRETNRHNLNLPFMLETYGHKLFEADPDEADAYFRSAPDREGLDRYELADRYLVEMLELLRLHYDETSGPVLYSKCGLAMTKAKVGKLHDAEVFANVCRSAIDAIPENADRHAWIERLRTAESLLKKGPSERIERTNIR